MVEDCSRERAGEVIGPNAIGKVVKLSSGAVANASEKLVSGGYAVPVTGRQDLWPMFGPSWSTC